MPESAVTKPDGSVDWSQGVNSIKAPTVSSPNNPNGLSRNELAWLNNATVRDGGITQRAGWKQMGRMRDGSAVFQGGFMYQPRIGSPYPVVAIGGHIYKVDPETGALTDLSLTAYAARPGPPVGIYLKNLNVPAATVLTVDPSSEAATVFGISGTITAPNIGSTVFVPLATPYTGPVPATVNIAQVFQIVSYDQCIHGGKISVVLKNINVNPGTNITVQPMEGYQIFCDISSPQKRINYGWTNGTFAAPAIGATVNVILTSTNNNLDAVITQCSCFLSPPPPFATPVTLDIGQLLHFNQFSFQLVNSIVPAPTTNVGTMPENRDYFFFCQAEEFLVIQAGDLKTLPLIWDGSILFRSQGITDTAVAAGVPGKNGIPSAGPMDYYMGRLWYAIGRTISAGDIVKGSSGTGPYDFRDSVLNVTENPLIAGGDGFTVPDNNGNVTALCHNANLDNSLGQGVLFAGTEKAIYSLSIPVTRTDWISLTSNNQPQITVVQLANGTVNDRSVVQVNGDLFFQSLEPQIRSIQSSVRYFGQWGNIPFSANVNRVLQFTDRHLLRFASGIFFNNRLIQTGLPRQLTQGVVHDALIPLDFMPISSFNQQRQPNWEGIYQGLQVMQLFVGSFGGKERAFAIVLSRNDTSFNLWELTFDDKFDEVDNRVEWFIEFPALNWGDEFQLKKLHAFELWIDRMFGTVEFQVEWRVDGDPCWKLWHQWKQCSARNSCEDANNPICYPITPFQESFRATMVGPQPPQKCEAITGRPASIGYQFQVRLTIKGFCRVRGFLLHAEMRERKLYDIKIC